MISYLAFRCLKKNWTGHSHLHFEDLWPPKSNQFIIEFSWKFVSYQIKFGRGVLELPRFQAQELREVVLTFYCDVRLPRCNLILETKLSLESNCKNSVPRDTNKNWTKLKTQCLWPRLWPLQRHKARYQIHTSIKQNHLQTLTSTL